MEGRHIFLKLFGAFELSFQGSETVNFPAKTASGVIAFLALNPNAYTTRSDIANAFWPGYDPSSARTNLRTALHRIKSTLPDSDLLLFDGEKVALNAAVVQSDFEEAERLHNLFLFQTDDPAAAEALRSEWEIRKQPLLEGWDFEWVETLRQRFDLIANDLGCELARLLEENGDLPGALAVWREVLQRVPHHVESLQNAVRLELELNGNARAMDLVRSAQDIFAVGSGLEMPEELRKIVATARQGFHTPVPRPDVIRTRGELMMLARMFESNLASNSREALALLSKEAQSTQAYAHPNTTARLLAMALDQTTGTSPERIQVAAQLVPLASLVCEYDLGHRWADFVIANLASDDPNYALAHSIKGFMYFEQRRPELARMHLQMSVNAHQQAGRLDDMLRALARIAGTEWHEKKFDEAIEKYKSLISAMKGRTDRQAGEHMAMAEGNLSFVYATIQNWQEAVDHAESSISKAKATNPAFEQIVLAPYGLSLFATGRTEEGITCLTKAVKETYRNRMLRFNQIALDFAGAAFSMGGNRRVAECVIQASTEFRKMICHDRSPAEELFIEVTTGFAASDLDDKSFANPLKGQSPSTLSQWVCEELRRLPSSSSHLSSASV